eukprot:1011674_1
MEDHDSFTWVVVLIAIILLGAWACCIAKNQIDALKETVTKQQSIIDDIQQKQIDALKETVAKQQSILDDIQQKQRAISSASKHSRFKPSVDTYSMLSKMHEEEKTHIAPIPSPLLCNRTISECEYLKQLQQLLKQYEDDDAICGSDIHAMLDSFGHLMEKHNYEEHDVADEFETIYNVLGGYCDIATCDQFKRHNTYRDHTSIATNLTDIYRVDDDIDVTHKQILDKIHCFYRHCYDIGNRLTSEQHTQQILSKTEHDTLSDFKVYQKPCTQGINIGYHARYKKFTSFVQESKTKTQQMFSVGTDFCYLENGRGQRVPKKYGSFKEELIHNNVAIITVQQFDNELRKSKLHLNSYSCKQWMKIYQAVCAQKVAQEIEYTIHQLYDMNRKQEHDFMNDSSHAHLMDLLARHPRIETKQLRLHHILSLMIYCNFTHLQFVFSATYRAKTNKETTASIISRHSSFYHFGKYLKEVVQWFGTEGVVENTFYHGIDAEVTFPKVSNFAIHCPLSTTTTFSVAVNFATATGAVVMLTTKAKSISVSWLSDFGNENEHLFIQSSLQFDIKNIILIQSGIGYTQILRCIKHLKEMTTYSKDITIMAQDQKLLKSLIENELYQVLGKDSKYKKCERLSKYEVNMFHQYCINVERLSIRKQRIYCDYFMVSDPKWDWVDLNVIRALYPNNKRLTYHYNKSHLCKDTMENIYEHFNIISNKGYSKQCGNKLVEIQIECKQPLFSDLVNQKSYEMSFKQIGVVMTVKLYPSSGSGSVNIQ